MTYDSVGQGAPASETAITEQAGLFARIFQRKRARIAEPAVNLPFVGSDLIFRIDAEPGFQEKAQKALKAIPVEVPTATDQLAVYQRKKEKAEGAVQAADAHTAGIEFDLKQIFHDSGALKQYQDAVLAVAHARQNPENKWAREFNQAAKCLTDEFARGFELIKAQDKTKTGGDKEGSKLDKLYYQTPSTEEDQLRQLAAKFRLLNAAPCGQGAYRLFIQTAAEYRTHNKLDLA